MMMKAKTKLKKWSEMTAAELAQATRRFEKPIRFEDTRPLTPRERARFERARHVDELDERLLKQARAYAKRKKLTMIQLVERGLRRELAVD
jgi:hypothetical protein